MGADTSRLREKLRDITIEDQHIRETDEVLGKGSYGEVKVVTLDGVRCAGKKLHPLLIERLNDGSQTVVGKFVNECLQMSKLRHPNIVQLLGVYFTSNEPDSVTTCLPVLVMELLAIRLGDFLDEYCNVPAPIKYSILYDVSLGLLYLHKQTPPVIHRDLTVNNVLLTDNLKAKIADFGVARVLNVKAPRKLGRGKANRCMTVQPGTQCVMSPEASVPEAEYDAKLDIFSFGHMIIHVVIQEWPMPCPPGGPDPSNPESMVEIERTEVQRRQTYIDKMEEDHCLRHLAIQCLANDPKSRPKTEEIVEELKCLSSKNSATLLPNPLESLKSLLKGSGDAPTPDDRSSTAGDEGIAPLEQLLKDELRAKDEEIEELKKLTESLRATNGHAGVPPTEEPYQDGKNEGSKRNPARDSSSTSSRPIPPRKALTSDHHSINDLLKERSGISSSSALQKEPFGTVAPVMIPDDHVSMCQFCSDEFTVTHRRHHCRACGKVVCGNCSQYKAYLQYADKFKRVCEECFYLSQAEGIEAPEKTTKTGALYLRTFSEDTVVAGYVNQQDGKKWTRMWYQVNKNCVLYRFKAHEDIKAVESMPLPGCKVTSDRGSSTFQLIHASGKRQFRDTFSLDSPASFDEWVEALEDATTPAKLSETPSPSSKPRRGYRRRTYALSTVSRPQRRPPSVEGDIEDSLRLLKSI